MSNNLSPQILLVGTGRMAVDYFKVLNSLNCDITVVGRGKLNSNKFWEVTGHQPITGGLQKFLDSNKTIQEKAIVAVGMEALNEASIQLIRAGIKVILVEKPAGLNFKEIEELARIASESNTRVFVAYNRRFYASVKKAAEIIQEDGGVTSFNFEFTEWSHVIENLDKIAGIKENWFLGNSTHVIDLAFFLGGEPERITCYTTGSLNWHPKASIFAGAGITQNGALFNYAANWEAPGRWGIEVLTKKHRLILRPLEKLWMQNIGSIRIDNCELDDSLDLKYKPGLYLQTKNFMTEKFDTLFSLKEFSSSLKHLENILTPLSQK